MASISRHPTAPRRALAGRTLAAWLAAALAAVCLILGIPSCARRNGARPRHVILISLDTARADHFGFLGNPAVRTPRLDAIARESIVFEDCMTAAPSTLASHTSLFTGKYPHHHGVPRNGFMVNRENQMLPEILKQAGFRTAGFAGSFSLDSRFDFAQGFDHYDEEYDVFVGEGGADQNQRPAEAVNAAVKRYLDQTGVPDHLFLFVHYFDPHQPYAAPAPFDTLYDPAGRKGLPTMRELKKSPALTAEAREGFARRFEMQYASEITYLDHHLGRLLDDLRERGILEDALLVITSDHGENLWDHPAQFDHGHTVYQSTMRAVCVMRLPRGESGGTRRKQLISNVDVLPTLLGELGLDPPRGIDGERVRLREPEAPLASRTRFGQATKPWQEVETDPRWTNLRKSRCVCQGRFKLIQTPWLGTEELYDLGSDPDERTDLLKDPSPRVAALAASLRRKLEHWAASAKPLPSRFEPAQQEETIRRLKSLGYIN
ncbi:MAG: sulfatase [Candidatus Eisenbacteria bacterium]|nr:sulfatase [Candidatus Eisenbacteria bacterium]